MPVIQTQTNQKKKNWLIGPKDRKGRNGLASGTAGSRPEMPGELSHPFPSPIPSPQSLGFSLPVAYTEGLSLQSRKMAPGRSGFTSLAFYQRGKEIFPFGSIQNEKKIKRT